MRVIINADDLGKSLEVNHAIEDCIKNGLITSSTIMAGGEAFDDAIRIAKSYPQISFGVHLTIDDGDMSLTKAPVFTKVGITDDNGRFIRYGIKNVKSYSAELKEAIYYEWMAQINKVKDAGVNISHIDSHHHFHTIPALRKLLVNLLKNNDIHCVRLSLTKTLYMYLHHADFVTQRNPGVSSDANRQKTSNKENKLRIGLRVLHQLVWNFEMKHKFTTTDYFCSYGTFLKNEKTLSSFFINGTLELMCHPGHPDYSNETNSLKDLAVTINKISYNSL